MGDQVSTMRVTEGYKCPKCGSMSTKMVEELADSDRWLCRVCGKKWRQPTHDAPPARGNWLWRNLDSLENARKAAREAAYVAIFIAVASAVVATLTSFGVKVLDYDPWLFVDAALTACIAWRIWKLSRAWSVVGFVYYVSSIMNAGYGQIFEHRPNKVGFLTIIFLFAFINGVRATFAYHRLTRQQQAQGAPASSTAWSIPTGSNTQLAQQAKVAMPVNIKRVCAYTGLLFLWTFVVGFVFGVMKGGAGLNLPVLQGLTVLTVMIAVFGRLAIVQTSRTYEHGLAAALLVWLLSFFPNVLWFKMPMSQWGLGVFLVLVAMIIGVPLGRFLAGRQIVAKTADIAQEAALDERIAENDRRRAEAEQEHRAPSKSFR